MPLKFAAATPARHACILAAAMLGAVLCLGVGASRAATEAGPPGAAREPAGPDGAGSAAAAAAEQPPPPAAESNLRARLRGLGEAAGPFAPGTYAPAPTDAELLDRLCAQKLRTNEEDRVFGLISLAVRATIRYEDAPFAADVIDDAEQDALGALLKDCSRIAATDEAHRLGTAIDAIQEATLNVMREHARPDYHERRSFENATAADLSEELTSEEIDAWLDSLSPRERALAVFLYASDVNRQQIAAAVGVPVDALNRDFAATKTRLLSYFREDDGNPSGAPGGRGKGPAIQYQLADASAPAEFGDGAAALDPPSPPDPGPGEPLPGHPGVTLQISGISPDLYAGWSLLAIVRGLPSNETLKINDPFIVATAGDKRRMIVDGVAEIGSPEQPVRRFLFKAYAIDGDSGGADFHDILHIADERVDNPQALLTLRNPELSNIEIARCLWHDYGKMPDPGLCR